MESRKNKSQNNSYKAGNASQNSIIEESKKRMKALEEENDLSGSDNQQESSI